MSIRRRAAMPPCCATAGLRAPATRPTPTIRQGRRAIPAASSSWSPPSGRPRAFDPSAGLGASASLAGYANASVSWLQAENQQASNASAYQSALATQASSALSNATGVNLDAEMTNMLNLENSYASTAKLLTTVNSMFSALLNAA